MFKKLKQLKKNIDTAAMAVAFAEAGEWKTAEQLMDGLKISNDRTNPKMLFASANREFSPAVIDYAVNLASRLKLDILALNIFEPVAGFAGGPIGKDLKYQNRFQHLREMHQLLQKKTGELGIVCDQVLLKDDMRTTITKISQLIRRIEIIIIQRNRANDPVPNLNIPVYLVAPKKR